MAAFQFNLLQPTFRCNVRSLCVCLNCGLIALLTPDDGALDRDWTGGEEFFSTLGHFVHRAIIDE